ncbi:MAG: hypothetical protein F6J93_11985 [Oscillatoria sp. SIO1A7]|nr:hypothetical protein [Oscillatoria sp. SIO1A7]
MPPGEAPAAQPTHTARRRGTGAIARLGIAPTGFMEQLRGFDMTFNFAQDRMPSVRMRRHPKASRCRIYKKQGGAKPSFFPGANSRVGAIAPYATRIACFRDRLRSRGSTGSLAA